VIGDRWITDFNALEELLSHAGDAGLGERWAEVKQANKIRLAAMIRESLQLDVDVNSLFDCQIKRIHEYKRQFLNLLHVITLYNQIRVQGQKLDVPRTVIFAGKAAPGYRIAKVIVQLIHGVADVINHDPRVGDQLKVVFLPNYNVSLAETIIPAADLSEQISTAGTEASGTGNMKCMLNGALTIGTLDGANIEIREAVGDEHFFEFGKTVEEVRELNANGYDPWKVYQTDPELREAVDMIRSGFFSSGDETVFQPLIDSLSEQRDRYLVFEDYADYVRCQNEVSKTYVDQNLWMKKSIINTACAVRFSSDRTVQTYAREIWGLGECSNLNEENQQTAHLESGSSSEERSRSSIRKTK
ncbi:MAG: glycogen/starch/alpha-glucan phosphorylase, partial [Planctomycetaceae bacterium]|nr:glycogen/starch/alpha-glucan phosphorylase [Planctomycetaceae bacterium]